MKAKQRTVLIEKHGRMFSMIQLYDGILKEWRTIRIIMHSYHLAA